jgi:hypothetical protein
MAHQAHALPWNTLASNVKYTFSHTHEPKRKDIFALGLEKEEKEAGYFSHALAQRIAEFSKTERAKFAPRETYHRRAESWRTSIPDSETAARPKGGCPETRMVYPDALQHRYFGHVDDSLDDDLTLRCRYRGWGCPTLQQITRWSASEPGSSNLRHADTLKIMMIEAAGMPPALSASAEHLHLRSQVTESLLLLAHHDKVDIHAFVHLGSGHSFGLDLLAADSLRAYLYLNVLLILEERGSGVCDVVKDDDDMADDPPTRRAYMDLLSYSRLLGNVADTCDGDAQNLVHWDFFYRRTESFWEIGKSKDVMADRAALAEYLKGLWRVLVMYDMILREAGHAPDWEALCKWLIRVVFNCKWYTDASYWSGGPVSK